MKNQQRPSKGIHIALWICQSLLALSLLWAGIMKIFQPVDKLAGMWPWAGQVPVALVKLTGVVDILARPGPHAS